MSTTTAANSLEQAQQTSLTTHAVADRFLELCNQGKNFDVMRTLYSPDIVSVEGDGSETVGQMPVIQKSERWVADKTINGQTIRGPFFNGANASGGQFAVHFVVDVTRKTDGARTALEEVAVYTVANGKITREQFFYAGTR